MTAFLLEYHFLPVSYVYAACGVRYWTALQVVKRGQDKFHHSFVYRIVSLHYLKGFALINNGVFVFGKPCNVYIYLKK